MKLLFIYGSPAVGKLTVAEEIAARTNIKVFHNHLTIDAVAPVFDFGTKPFWKIVNRFRLEIIAEAARSRQNLIYTFCYAKGSDDAHVTEVIDAVENNGGKVFFVFLTAEKEVIERRVNETSRHKYRKLNDPETLREVWEKHELFSPVPHSESLILDNSDLTPAEAALKIIKYFQLRNSMT